MIYVYASRSKVCRSVADIRSRSLHWSLSVRPTAAPEKRRPNAAAHRLLCVSGKCVPRVHRKNRFSVFFARGHCRPSHWHRRRRCVQVYTYNHLTIAWITIGYINHINWQGKMVLTFSRNSLFMTKNHEMMKCLS